MREILGSIHLKSNKNGYLVCKRKDDTNSMNRMNFMDVAMGGIDPSDYNNLESRWVLWMIAGNVILLQSMRSTGDYLQRGDASRGVTLSSNQDEQSQWKVEIVSNSDPKAIEVRLKSWKGDYLYNGEEGVTTWLDTDGSKWTIEIIEAGNKMGELSKIS